MAMMAVIGAGLTLRPPPHDPAGDGGGANIGISVVLVASALVYLLAARAIWRAGRRPPGRWRQVAYLTGVASLAGALLGPLDSYNDTSFAAHMAQHLLLTLVAPPLMLLGQPTQTLLRGLGPARQRAALRATIGRPAARRLLAGLAHPMVIYLIYNGGLLIWHTPPLYQAAVVQPTVHLLEHACFFGSAWLFWWVLVDPFPRSHRLSTSAALILLFATWMTGDLLGATITLADRPLYPLYSAAHNPFGLTPLEDQRLGGVIMWVGGGGLYAGLMVGYLVMPYLRRAPTAPAAGRFAVGKQVGKRS